ncbi:MAG: HlyD family efflux transporter periplasmic adaptor subunit [Chloroflexota bacterium]
MHSDPTVVAGAALNANERDPTREVAQRLPITDRPSWLILLGLGLLVVAGIAWAVFGSAPDAVTGHGMVVPAEGFVEVGTELQGTVIAVDVLPGDEVQAGSVVARIRTDEGEPVTVTTPVDGRVATVLVRAGGVTDRGTALLTVEPSGSELVVVAFVAAGPGKRVQPGMPALVGLASVPRSQYGMLEGRVEAVSPVPVSPERVILIVGGNVSLAEYFLTEGPVLEVTVSLKDDATTPSGYAWTTGQGPSSAVTPGTLGEVSVVVSDEAPLQRIVR